MAVGWSITPYTTKVVGSIPSQDTYLGCGFKPSLCAYGRKPIDVSFFLPLSKIKSYPRVRIKKIIKKPSQWALSIDKALLCPGDTILILRVPNLRLTGNSLGHRRVSSAVTTECRVAQSERVRI